MEKRLPGSLSRIVLLFIIPVSIVFLGFQLRSANGPFTLAATDPEFIFFFSGIALTLGHFNLFIDQPGTPLQVLEGIIARIIHVFRPGKPFLDDALQNPDLYLHIISICLIFLVAAGVFLAGYVLYRKTSNLPAALLLQFSPFVAEPVFATLERAMIEPLFIPLIALFFVYLWLDATDRLPRKGIFSQKVLLYGMFAGFGLSLKFTFVPLLLIPFFILTSWKQKLWYILITLCSFYLFTFPLFKKTFTFFRWIKALILHSGIYGTGERNFIDPALFLSNLHLIIYNWKFLIFSLVAGTFVLVLCLIPPVRKKIGQQKQIALLAGLLTAVISGMFLVAKHYSERYLIPEALLGIPILIASIQLFIRMISPRFRRTEFLLYSLTLVGIKNI